MKLEFVKEPIQRHIAILMMVVLMGSAAIVAVDRTVDRAAVRRDAEVANQLARRELGEIALAELVEVELRMTRLAATMNVHEIDFERGKIHETIASTRNVLEVLREGGVYTRVLPANFNHSDLHEQRIAYRPDSTRALQVEFLHLGPRLTDIEGLIGPIVECARARLAAPDHEREMQALGRLDLLAKEALTYIRRSRENATRIFRESHDHLVRLQEQEAEERQLHTRTGQAVLAVVILFCGYFTYLTMRRVAWILRLRRGAENALAEHRDRLEETVSARTAELRAINDSLAESEQRFRGIVDNLGMGIAAIGPDLEVLAVNPEMRRWFPDVDLARRPRCYEAFRLERGSGPCRDCPTLAALESGRVCEAEMITSIGGEERIVRLLASPILGENGRVTGAIEMLEDITERHRAERELFNAKQAAESANRAKSDFLAMMSHEIRTPMNGVIGMTDLALQSDLDPDQRDCIAIANASAHELLGIINDILDFSKIEVGKLSVERRLFALRSSISPAMTMLAANAGRKDLEFIVRIPSRIPDQVLGDAMRLRQVLVNLAGNAVKFTSAGEIVVEAELVTEKPDGIELRFEVRDTGIGIPEEKQAKIFEAFEQAETSTDRKYGGTGLGLSISSSLVHLMGGRIGVDSTPGRGSVFWFTVALGLDRSGSAGHEPLANVPIEGLRGKAVLAVERNPVNRRTIEDYLGLWGADPVVEESIDAGLRRAATRRFDLVLVDEGLPDGGAATLIREIASTSGPDCPVVRMVSSAARGEDLKGLGRQTGSTPLVKPLCCRSLLEAAGRALGFEVPRAAGEMEPMAAPGPDRDRLQILLVEDNPVNRTLASRVLGQKGHDVALAGNGQEAVEAVGRTEFDVVLMDVQMPVMDGLEATRIIRRREGGTGGHLPIIAMTAQALQGDREICLAAGMDGYITKPIIVAEVMGEITAVLEGLAGAKATDPV